ncbi:peptidyl-prolyl cis-trans isomerasehypothetical protein [Limosa lapponica baueri]|uniref:Peptidyl-prolyl cis-trans isomerase n=1 Tax=Limosa lapponica baueri TaxID=1758121 RepID=A0A2I0TKB9_LIMLA|nr:peptidyl-prolyl cis-trans isomerasehypothetical protein [Limosa lapponica baueri]
MVNNGSDQHGSQFLITTGENLDYLDGVHTVFGEVTEGMDVLKTINEAFVDKDFIPYQDIRINHTVILDDPFEDPPGLSVPDRSPEPTKEQLDSGRIGADEEIDDLKGRSADEIEEVQAEKEAKTRAILLEMEEDCEKAYFKMDNVLIDDRRIHVDFSQSVAKIKWKGKGGRYTKDDFKEYEKERDRPSKLALKEKVKPKQEYPFLVKVQALGARTKLSSTNFAASDKVPAMVNKAIVLARVLNTADSDRKHEGERCREKIKSEKKDRHRSRSRSQERDYTYSKQKDKYRDDSRIRDWDKKRDRSRSPKKSKDKERSKYR